MSSALKDARWQLAEEMATNDGFDFHNMGFYMKSGYLDHAQMRLGNSDDTEIDRLAAKFNQNGEG